VDIRDTPEFNDMGSELRRNWPERKLGWFEPIAKEALPAAGDVWQKQGLATRVVADFVAPESGELFLYVNDAIQVFPFASGPGKAYGSLRRIRDGAAAGSAECFARPADRA
jgi:hypothetical protein